ncbi:MAG: Hsp20 family protein [Acidobacteriia bacterium]|nr:Hsp20 family protein [Terriglobia bacterium]
MSSNPTTNIESTPGPKITQSPEETFYERVQDLYDAVAQRAFEIFEASGAIHGQDFDHWLEAESEFLNPMPLEIDETDTAFVVRAEVPGFSEDDIEIIVEPRRLFITAAREEVGEEEEESAEMPESEASFEEVLRSLDLASEVDPSQVMATLNDGILEITLIKQAGQKADRPAEAA